MLDSGYSMLVTRNSGQRAAGSFLNQKAKCKRQKSGIPKGWILIPSTTTQDMIDGKNVRIYSPP